MTTPLESVRNVALRLDGAMSDYDALLEQIGERPIVLLGEASHGTREFYRMRAEISRRLIEEKGFEAVVVEADWPDALRLNRYARHDGDDTLMNAFADFQRFPQWMWRNHEVRDFLAWLHQHNAGRDRARQTGFYGLDVYSLHRSAEAVIEYLQGIDPDQAKLAREGYACFDHADDPFRYGRDAAFGINKSCEDTAVRLLADLLEKSTQYLREDGRRAADEQFFAEQNARVVINAEAYYRAMFGSRVDTWNLRDDHMTDTLAELRQHLRDQGGQGKLIVWAHNSHLGDASSTEMGWGRFQHNVGQLVRQRFGAENAFLVGFTTHTGYVSAAQDWDGPVEHRWVRPSLDGSYERLFHESGLDRFYLPLTDERTAPLREIRLERAIGVIYRPETERQSHYFQASLPSQFDAVFHLDETNAVEPFEKGELWRPEVIPDTYPFGV
ncbi:erythromycin esterase family protein [Halomonas sp. McH1-25]|uniref:erythromycin esterase family protein n=1 Tax=unclassified Halomonas TaxID=2609666 RepID=UPI001EF62424|nr:MULTISPECIES: erythromycin esterase family protein [unclassified Halomonas]MCG7598756.1 erythromycin esterase family protein [Halomonas sp. McH1-25]MCP1340719.1 erythromycin esterase family protein [Halomonas sp. FL8]MCP1359490.1 erythromycin esterase family protein [Halomonas sp. BBD45]MCP1364125.1 erythromycin esterase family protein [Halomonas sp. BBD48]